MKGEIDLPALIVGAKIMSMTIVFHQIGVNKGGYKMYISRAKFNTYTGIQMSGKTNMFDLDEVIRLNRKISEIELTKKELHYIMKNYNKLCTRFGYVKVQSI